MAVYKSNIPQAEFLMGAMRSIGYSFEAAIADIIDNSISANAKNIQIKFPLTPANSYVSILDDGNGMNKNTLFDAMKYGSNSCELARDENDLGRFGLGMKAASLSQCKMLTVVSKQNDKISAYQWDYDIILERKEWLVAELNDLEISRLPEIEELEMNISGTLVIWQNFDTLEKSSGDVFSSLKDLKIKIVDYLSLIFHRYLNGETDYKVNLKINSLKIKGYDPFLERHKKTNIRQEFNLALKDTHNVERKVIIQPYVLPYQKDLSKEDLELLGGITNLRTKQGFYIYRNKRLIIWGTWFGISRNELTKNARIRVDIPNTLDDIWGIDIKKQNATIPKSIKNSLTKAVSEIMDFSIKIQNHRGRIAKLNDDLDYIWNRVQCRDNKFIYNINRNSRIFELVKKNVDDEAMNRFEMVLEEIERSIPYQQIYIDISQDIVDEEDDEERLKDIENKGLMWVRHVLELGHLTPKQTIDQLFKSEPFCKHPEMINNFYTQFEI
ncbi:MAG: ATP-binding protein [Ignavibacteria bacterium]|nr:ATP-binding protein [Ignavibacteria bacterium]